jgi:curved DNA-binding protein CbpA
MTVPPDPYRTLGVSAGVSDDELRAAYRRAVLRFHPDHNGGSAESTRRFEEVQEAYARIRRLRERPRVQSAEPDPGVQARLAEMERELAAERRARESEAKRARERERRAAQERQRIREQARRAAADETATDRPSDEELGYVKTDDSFSKIFSDAVSEVSDRLSEPEHQVPKRISDLIDELESKLGGGEHPKR